MTLPDITKSALFANLPSGYVVKIAGNDAARIVNNISTNDVLKLPNEFACEAFITDLRGWVIAHCVVLKLPDSVVLVGSHPVPAKICGHVDRYIIREDARVADETAEIASLVLFGNRAHAIVQALFSNFGNDSLSVFHFQIDSLIGFGCGVPLMGSSSFLICVDRQHLEQFEVLLTNAGAQACTADDFQLHRVMNFWPLAPADISEKTIPQELDRDAQAISFTKGCYLGQETIARLDARGQLQKKLCLAEIHCEQEVAPGIAIHKEGKDVGVITSSAYDGARNRWVCLAYLRRGHFEPGTSLECHGQELQVLPVPGHVRND